MAISVGVQVGYRFLDRVFAPLKQVAVRVMVVVGAVGLFAGVAMSSPGVVVFGVCCLGGGVGTHVLRGRVSLRKVDTAIVVEWAKVGRKITAPTQMVVAKEGFRAWLKEQEEEDLVSLWKMMPDKMTNILENFPDIIAEESTAKQIAFMATHLYQAGTDERGVAITTIIQLSVARIEEGRLYGQYREFLSAFAHTPLIHPELENQLTAMKKRLRGDGAHLMGIIHRNSRRAVSERMRLAEEAAREPIVSEERRREIAVFASELVQKPIISAMFKRRQQLTEVSKRGEISLLVESLGVENIEKLWAFEAQVDNRSNDPTVRLSQMFGALTQEQLAVSLQADAFYEVVNRYPQAALSLSDLKSLADSERCDAALYSLYKQNPKCPVLSSVAARCAGVAANPEPLTIDLESFVSELRATLEPIEVGALIDRMDEEQLTAFVGLLGEGIELDLFWKIQEKKIVAQREAEKQKSRLKRIYTRLSPAQLRASIRVDGFGVVLSNTEEKYIEAAVSALTPVQLEIIAADPAMLRVLNSLIHHFDSADKGTFHKLLAIATNVPESDELILLRGAAGKRYVTLAEPEGGWGVYENRQGAVKYLDDLFKKKSRYIHNC